MQRSDLISPSTPSGLPSSTGAWSVPDTTLRSTFRALDAALQARDLCTHAHSQRVIFYSLTLGRMMGLTERELVTLEHGVFLHDIGKIHVPDLVLQKPGPLSAEERTVIEQHSSIGYDMLRHNPLLADAAGIVLSHHERFDGSGYPQGLSGEDIPLGARICAVSDAFDALTSIRPYRAPMGFDEAWDYIDAERGRHFDPAIVEFFTALSPAQWQAVRRASSAGTALTSLIQAA